jgi:predicted regulator of Ras-like GTPase activity (Roadblock/LC7/MglB family)
MNPVQPKREADAMFNETLREIVEGTEGGVAGLLMGFDGIPVDSWTRADSELDITTVGMELSMVLKDIRSAAEQLDAGGPREVAIQAEKLTTVVRLLNGDYFLALALTPEGNLGKCRFLMRVAAPKFVAALS